jgi:hypothetical protein
VLYNRLFILRKREDRVPPSIVLLLTERWVKVLGLKAFSTFQWHIHDAPVAFARQLVEGKDGKALDRKGSMTAAVASGRQGSAMPS